MIIDDAKALWQGLLALRSLQFLYLGLLPVHNLLESGLVPLTVEARSL